ncbi:MAG: exosortase O [Acidobacteriota bacterium]
MEAIAVRLFPARAARIAANALICGVWLWLYRPVFDYLAIIFTREDFRTNQIVLLAVLLLIGLQWRQGQSRPQIDVSPQLSIPAIILVLGGSILYLLVERFFDINTLSASMFFLTGYGLLGLWMQPTRWRQGLPAALLVVGALPFGEHMQTFIGYPMRILTASIVRDGLTAVGISSIGVDTILVFENGVSQVDLPCSGVKSLWTGGLFLIAATWIERRRLDVRWLFVAIALGVLLFLTNLARVGTLVVVGPVLGLSLVAAMLHIPLGVLGFCAACATALLLLRLVPAAVLDDRHPSYVPRPTWLPAFLILVISILALAYRPRPQTGLTQPPISWNFPAPLITQPLPLKPVELEWFTRDGADSADRWRFEWGSLSGSLMLIPSATWRAHHRPERCFEVYGLALNDSTTYLVAPDLPVRLVSLGDREGKNLFTAAYWFQSPSRTTDDYGTRMWADLSPQHEKWVLVSILFDRALDPNTTEVQALYQALRDTVAANLKGELSP